MDLAGTFIREILALVVYALIAYSVYKLHKLGDEVAEIKAMLKRSRAGSDVSVSPALAASATDDDAAAYAENLLRSVNAPK